jgi:hypothetical protein
MRSQEKVEAIYDLRAAAEHKVRAEIAVEKSPTPERRDALLEATLRLEDRTQTAIEACHYCGRSHLADEPHTPARDNVIDVVFGKPNLRSDLDA